MPASVAPSTAVATTTVEASGAAVGTTAAVKSSGAAMGATAAVEATGASAVAARRSVSNRAAACHVT